MVVAARPEARVEIGHLAAGGERLQGGGEAEGEEEDEGSGEVHPTGGIFLLLVKSLEILQDSILPRGMSEGNFVKKWTQGLKLSKLRSLSEQ